jgi:hypothetical protein
MDKFEAANFEILKRKVLEIVKANPGIDDDRIAEKLREQNPIYNATGFEIDVIDNLVEDGWLEVIDYVLPENDQTRSLYFPEGTTVTVWMNI